MGKLFERNYYTPFNWYIIEKMPLLIKFFDNICQISLPPFIEKLINDELPENYEYNYFKENPEENILYRNICYTPNELYSLITNVEKFKDDFSIDKMILDKLIFNIKILENMKNNTNNKQINKEINRRNSIKIQNTINCFLFTDLINNEKYKKILNIKIDKNKKYFNIK